MVAHLCAVKDVVYKTKMIDDTKISMNVNLSKVTHDNISISLPFLIAVILKMIVLRYVNSYDLLQDFRFLDHVLFNETM